MTDLQDLRSRLRDDVRRGSSTSEDGAGKSYALVFATCGIVIGFALFMFVPRFFQTSGTAVVRVESPVKPGEVPRYAGRSFDEAGVIADNVCAQKVRPGQPVKPPRITQDQMPEFLNIEGVKRAGEQMNCLLTEAPQRYCSVAQRKMIVGELTLYFRGIELANKSGALRGSEPRSPGGADVSPDPRVLAALEARLRDGHLTMANRDVISSEAPRWVRDRLVKIEPRKVSLCPENPWWAVWK
jgi:hypothetical protein